MRQRVESYGISKEDVDMIVKKVEEGHYQVSPAMAGPNVKRIILEAE